MKALPALLCVVSAASLVACSHARTWGNFVPDARQQDQDTMALDAAKQLTELYAPASTSLTLQHLADDGFGRALVATLRRDGFAVAESNAASHGEQLVLSYVVDRIDVLLRVTLVVRSDELTLSLTRAYAPQTGVLRPAGAWARQTE
jgi:hypothetical protein